MNLRSSIVATVAFIALFVGLVGVLSGQIPKPGDAPQPLSPLESAKRVKLPAGFRLELVASEPLIREPSGVCWDEQGRLYVCELHGYNLEGHYDIEELNKTGQLDRIVRRIDADERAKEAAKEGTFGTVKRLIDVDGDGRMDKSEVWADRLPPCYGICPARGGIIVACAPDIVFLADRDGNGEAEVRETLLTGFLTGALERGINAPQWGLDDWIYFGSGHGGGKITGLRLKEPVELPRTDFRIKADGSAIEPISGTTLGMGFSFTKSGERFVSSVGWVATNVVPLPWRYLVRNPYLAAPPLNDQNPPDRRTYPISRPHPWRSKRADDPGFARFYTDRYGIAESAPNGYFTSCCSPLVYQDSVLPGMRGQLLACEPAQNLITRRQLQREGLRQSLVRITGEEQTEFLASSDQWFHPIALAHAPDGTVVICDFYREIIEDYSAIPRYLQQQYGLVKGNDHGRLWRLTHDDAPRAPPADMTRLSAQQLAGEVASPHFWRRQTARRLLVERNDRSVAKTLAALARDSNETEAVLNALYTLDALQQLKADDVKAALTHAEVDVRVHGLRLAERWLNTEPDLMQTVLRLVADQETIVRLQLALSLGEMRDARVLPALANLACESGDDDWMAVAIVSSAPSTADQLVAEILSIRKQGQQLSSAALSILEMLASVIGSRHNDDSIGRLLETAASLERQPESAGKEPAHGAAQLRLLDGLVTGLKRGKAEPLRSAAGQRAIQQLLSSTSPQLRYRALQVAGLVRLNDSPAMKAAWGAAVDAALGNERPINERVAAVTLLSAAPYSELARLKQLLDPRQPLALQLAAVQAMSSATEPIIVEDLLADFAKLSPTVQTAVIDAVCSRQDRLPKLLEMIERNVVSSTDLPAIRRTQFLEHSNTTLRAKAARLLAPATSGDRREVLERFGAALKVPRDAARGKVVFEKQCAKCHQLGKLGFAVGPDLDAVRTRPDESLLLDILDPSGTIDHKFRAYTVTTSEGRVHSGVLASESATSISLRRENDATDTILRRDIDEMQASSKSLMPEGIEKEVTPQDLADLFAFLRESLGPQLPPELVLFDDEPEFLAKLTEGDGVAALTTADRFSGNAALRLTAGQRYSARIAGWEYRIVEKPGPGEFRYLRLIWKSSGSGAMIELAERGSWPPADKPTRRYFSGKNTTPWQATQISLEVPADWTVVTVDLWKDFGEFTLTGIAPTALGGDALFDRITLLRTLDSIPAAQEAVPP